MEASSNRGVPPACSAHTCCRQPCEAPGGAGHWAAQHLRTHHQRAAGERQRRPRPLVACRHPAAALPTVLTPQPHGVADSLPAYLPCPCLALPAAPAPVRRRAGMCARRGGRCMPRRWAACSPPSCRHTSLRWGAGAALWWWGVVGGGDWLVAATGEHSWRLCHAPTALLPPPRLHLHLPLLLACLPSSMSTLGSQAAWRSSWMRCRVGGTAGVWDSPPCACPALPACLPACARCSLQPAPPQRQQRKWWQAGSDLLMCVCWLQGAAQSGRMCCAGSGLPSPTRSTTWGVRLPAWDTGVPGVAVPHAVLPGPGAMLPAPALADPARLLLAQACR